MTVYEEKALYREMCDWNRRGNDAVRAGNDVQAEKCYYRAEQIAARLNQKGGVA